MFPTFFGILDAVINISRQLGCFILNHLFLFSEEFERFIYWYEKNTDWDIKEKKLFTSKSQLKSWRWKTHTSIGPETEMEGNEKSCT